MDRDQTRRIAEEVVGKSAKEILMQPGIFKPGAVGEFFRVAAQVESNDALRRAIETASDESGKVARGIAWLTALVAMASVAQVVATAWPYLASWLKHLG